MNDMESQPHPSNMAARNRRYLTEAIDGVWDIDLLDRLLHPVAAHLRVAGYDAPAVVDAIAHHLDAAAARFWYGHGYTAHQAHLMEPDERAMKNLWGHSAANMNALLGSNIPHDYLINVLRVALSPGDVDTFITNWQNGTPAQRDFYANREAMQAALLEHPNPILGCCP